MEQEPSLVVLEITDRLEDSLGNRVVSETMEPKAEASITRTDRMVETGLVVGAIKYIEYKL